MVLDKIKEVNPETPTVIYIKHSGALLERMAATGVDVVSMDWTVDMAEGRERLDKAREGKGMSRCAVQGNLDPGLLYADFDTIEERTIDIIKKVRGGGAE
jgi:uroporphyrinogen decarboxylase